MFIQMRPETRKKKILLLVTGSKVLFGKKDRGEDGEILLGSK